MAVTAFLVSTPVSIHSRSRFNPPVEGLNPVSGIFSAARPVPLAPIQNLEADLDVIASALRVQITETEALVRDFPRVINDAHILR